MSICWISLIPAWAILKSSGWNIDLKADLQNVWSPAIKLQQVSTHI